MAAAPRPWPAPPRRPGIRIMVIALAVGVVLCWCGAVTIRLVGTLRAPSISGPAADAAEQFMWDVRRGDIASAYDMLCDTTRAEVSRESFAKIVNDLGPTGSYVSSIESMTTGTTSGQPTAEFRVALQYSAKHTARHHLRLVQERGGWHVCGDHLLA